MKSVDATPEEKTVPATPTTLIEWRELVPDWTLHGMLVFWLLALAWGLIGAFIIQPQTVRIWLKRRLPRWQMTWNQFLMKDIGSRKMTGAL